MALTLLQPGIQPAGQFDLADGLSPVGGECGIVAAQAGNSAADVHATMLQVELGNVTAGTASTVYHGLVDEGSTGYGTLFGNVIGGTVGQGTGFGASSTAGVVVVGPNSSAASGKATLWDKPGLYGVDDNAFIANAVGASADNAALNDNLYGNLNANTGLGTDGELWSDTGDGDGAGTGGAQGNEATATGAAAVAVGLFLGSVNDSSLVSTTTLAATAAATAETNAVYLLGTR